MTMTFDQAHELATAAFECYTLPEDMIVEETSGFSSTQESATATFSKPIFYYAKEDEPLLDEDGFNTSTAHFNVEVCLESGAIKDAYVIVSAGGNIVGEFTDENRRQAYEDAGLTTFFQAETLKL